jgi:hypothetical protein
MTKRPAEPDPIEAFLAPLVKLVSARPEVEGLVFWSGIDGWSDSPSELLEAEEIAFYAEGLLIDGFRMVWSVMAVADTPHLVDHIRLWFWQDDAGPPSAPAGWMVLETGQWPSA